MEPKDFLQPRIFLCKSSRFLRNLNSQVDPDGERGSALPQKDGFGNDDFAATCDPRHLEPKESENEISDEDDEDETSTDTTVRIFFLSKNTYTRSLNNAVQKIFVQMRIFRGSTVYTVGQKI